MLHSKYIIIKAASTILCSVLCFLFCILYFVFCVVCVWRQQFSFNVQNQSGTLVHNTHTCTLTYQRTQLFYLLLLRWNAKRNVNQITLVCIKRISFYFYFYLFYSFSKFNFVCLCWNITNAFHFFYIYLYFKIQLKNTKNWIY